MITVAAVSCKKSCSNTERILFICIYTKNLMVKAAPSGVGDLATSRAAEVRNRCLRAKQLAEAGDYEGARAALGEFWHRIGDRPKLEGLDGATQAELLLRAGSLSGWIGSASQIEGAQESAKDLISESARIFGDLGLTDKVAEAQIDLAVCYWRAGALDEARVTLRDVLDMLGESKGEQRLRTLANLALVEWSAKRYKDALRIQMEAAPLFEASSNHVLKGRFHSEYATVLNNVGATERRQDYVDRAFIEYTAASYHFEQAGHIRYVARTENNIGFLFLTAGKLIDAHQHLNRARALFVKLKDKGSIAQVDETRARTFLAQGLSAQAETAVRGSVRILEQGDERALLAEALTTYGSALAQLGRYERAQAQLKRAMDVARQAGDPEKAGIAALTIVEALSSYVPSPGLREYYRNAEALLAQSQSPGIDNRLGQCARALLAAGDSRVSDFKASATLQTATGILRYEASGNDQTTGQQQAVGPDEPWAGCSLENEVLRYEGDLIQRALEASGGSVTRAARMLGITHQGLAFILNGRHRSLLTVRTPVRRRRKSIFRNH